MKVNLDYYKSSEFNKLTAEELSIIDKYFNGDLESDVSYDSLLTLESTFSEIKALSDNRRNIVEFYPINSNETVLEVGAGFGEITGSFLDRAKEVVEKYNEIAKLLTEYDDTRERAKSPEYLGSVFESGSQFIKDNRAEEIRNAMCSFPIGQRALQET